MIFSVLLVSVILIFALTAVVQKTDFSLGNDAHETNLMGENSVSIVKDGKTDDRIVFSSDTFAGDQDFANSLIV